MFWTPGGERGGGWTAGGRVHSLSLLAFRNGESAAAARFAEAAGLAAAGLGALFLRAAARLWGFSAAAAPEGASPSSAGNKMVVRCIFPEDCYCTDGNHMHPNW